MRLMKSVLIAALIAAPAMTFAQSPAPAAPKPALAQRQFNQQRRIANGVRTGELNRRQTAGLERQQRSIHRQMHAMRARHNGRLTPRNRRVLNHRMNVASRRIYRAKHNG
jgi:hypothetical protein